MDPFLLNFHLNFVNEMEEQERRQQVRLEYRQIRDTSNPFETPDYIFHKLFRLPKALVREFIAEIQVFRVPARRVTAVPLHLQVLVTLNFLACGSYQTGVGRALNIAMSQPTVSRIIRKITNLVTQHLLRRHVRFPTTIQEVMNAKQGFASKLNFANAIGAIDCTHVAIVAPKNAEHNPAVTYLNRKGYYSINVQAICDADMIFTNINARYPGAAHDAAIWEMSRVNDHLRMRYTNGERMTFLLGDSGYPLQPWLITPIPDAAPDTPQGIFTHRHCVARNVIERAFGVLKQRFRCLMKHRVLHYSHEAAGKIVYTCVVLHNICTRNNIVLNEEIDDAHEDNHENHSQDVQGENDGRLDILEEGRFVRQNIINSFAH